MKDHQNQLLFLLAVALIAALALVFQPGPAPERSHARVGRDENSAIVFEGGSARIDLNRANRELLQTLPGIGEVLAGRIVEHRREHGAYASIEQLLDVPGIGPGKLGAMREALVITPAG